MADTTEGREALVHLRVPAATKARWVRQSRAAGMKLTDWIIERMERNPMNVFKVPEALSSQYHGAGLALVAIAAPLRYVVDMAPPEVTPPELGQTPAMHPDQVRVNSKPGVIVALRYLVDVMPADMADHMAAGGSHSVFFARNWLQTAEAGPVVRELQALGQVHVGMLSCWEFVEL